MSVVPLARILVVEDEPDIRMVARMALEKVGGFTVEECESGLQAVEAALAFSPDLVVLDVMMPEMDGPATLRSLRAHPKTGKIPVMYMTAKVQASEIARLKETGAIGVLSKPFDPMTLARDIRDLWDRHHAP